MTKEEHKHLEPAPRSMEIFVGLICLLMGLLLAFSGVVVFFKHFTSERVEKPVFYCAIGFVVVGWMLMRFARRLLLNRPRTVDDGLLSPASIRAGGLIFLAAAVMMLFDSPLDFYSLAFNLGAAQSCFFLAKRRRKKAEKEAVSRSQQEQVE